MLVERLANRLGRWQQARLNIGGCRALWRRVGKGAHESQRYAGSGRNQKQIVAKVTAAASNSSHAVTTSVLYISREKAACTFIAATGIAPSRREGFFRFYCGRGLFSLAALASCMIVDTHEGNLPTTSAASAALVWCATTLLTSPDLSS